jgi:hypothetical protein
MTPILLRPLPSRWQANLSIDQQSVFNAAEPFNGVVNPPIFSQ